MFREVRKLLEAICWFLAVSIMITCLVYWYQHPELTEMQMWIKFWWVHGISIMLGGLAIWLGSK